MNEPILRKLFLIFLFFITFKLHAQPDRSLPYWNASLPVEQRVNDLLSRMTLTEKIGQMNMYGPTGFKETGGGLDDGHLGTFYNLRDIEWIDQVQARAANTRLGIPLFIAIDAVHGHGKYNGATIFPTPLTLASSWEPGLVYESSKVTAREMRATGYNWNFFPNVDVVRDPRWGRTGETFGEDPFLVSEMAAAMVEGMQGQGRLGEEGAVACIKHFAAGGQPRGGLNFAPMDISERTLREVFFPPFKAAIDAGAMSLMAAHNELSGVPCHANEWLLTKILREEWGFEGFVSTDWHDIERLIEIHKLTDNMKEAIRLAIGAGVDIHMDGDNFTGPLEELVKEGLISEKRIDRTVRSVLTAKFEMGLFENARTDFDKIDKVVLTEETEALALESARKSLVLLKNENSILPLNKKTKKIFLSGPNAHSNVVVGDWTRRQPDENIVTLYEGLQQVINQKNIDYYHCGDIVSITNESIAEAVKRAKSTDVAILAVGGRSVQADEEWNFDKMHPGRTGGENVARSSLDLVGKQLELVQAVKATGVPTVVVLFNGRPLSINWIAENIEGIIEAWEPGMQGGKAVAEVLFGDVNPSGKLPITFPRSAGHIPDYYNHKPSAYYRKYKYEESTPLYPFGFGLSYTTFEYANIKLSREKAALGSTVTASVEVTNTGDRLGEEVVQLYIRDKLSSVTRPVKELKGFQKVALKPGETKTVRFQVNPEMLSFYNLQMDWGVEPGEFEVMIGRSSQDHLNIRLTLEE
ncbi:MAG: glycoside hydrolase family 3 C-terminal domain-containing protein [Cytophagales bacterium]|nr:glycoside hydrolase family 3 C-terminal domain-containing protein [Cytophagales bacterium]